MREYKFRGKRIDNGEWVYGDLTRYSEHHSYITVDLIKNEIYKVSTESVGQYVEFLDAYEGDIVKGEDTNKYGAITAKWYAIVKYNDEIGHIMMLDIFADEWFELDDYGFDKIIGNTTDNPDYWR